jgi:pilus assembly protein Flp/PilA
LFHKREYFNLNDPEKLGCKALMLSWCLHRPCRTRRPSYEEASLCAKDETAAVAVEYGLIAAGISVALIPVVGKVGKALNATFSSIAKALTP